MILLIMSFGFLIVCDIAPAVVAVAVAVTIEGVYDCAVVVIFAIIDAFLFI